jgi:ribokinase
MKKPVITVVGSFAVGMTLRTHRMPIFGETLIGSDFDMGPGGKGSNQAVGVARLGAEASFAGIIGQDKLAEIALDLYRAEGVNTDHLLQTTERATGVGFIILNEAGENGIVLDMGANELMTAHFVSQAEARIAAGDIVMSVLEIPVGAAARAMELAPAAKLDGEILQQVDYLTPNETELRILLGLAPNDPTPTIELAGRLKALGVGTLIVTQGEQGALILTEDGVEQIPAVAVRVVDTTGAGDAFNAGLAVALAEGKSLTQAVQFANCAGALACLELGVIPALATRRMVDQLYLDTFATS